MKVTLSDTEVKIVEQIGYARQQINNAKGLKDRRQDTTKDSTEMHIEGLAGEWAFCKAMNFYPDHEIEKRSVHDCRGFGGTWDVKTQSIPTSSLHIRFSKAAQGKRCDFYALVIGHRPDYEIVGWVEAEAIFQKDNIGDIGYGMFYKVPQSKLKKFRSKA